MKHWAAYSNLQVLALAIQFIIYIPSFAAETETTAPGEVSQVEKVTETEKVIEIGTTGLYNDLALLASEDLVFSASKRIEAIKTVPIAISVISSDHLRSLGGRYLPQILKLFPGIDVIQVTRTEFAVSLRGFANRSGFPPRDVLVLVDGRTVYDDFSGNVEWETLDIFPEDVGRIEMIRGAGSVIHGPNASRGVIDIITKPPEAISTFETDTSVIQDGFRQRVGGSLSLGSYSWKLTGGFNEAEVWNRFEDLPGFPLSNNNAARTWQFNTVLTKHLTGGAELRVGGGSNTGHILLHRTADDLVQDDQSTEHLQLEYEHPYLSVRSYWNYREVKFFDAMTGNPGATRRQHLYDLEVVHRILRLGRNDLSLGATVRYIKVNASSVNNQEEQFNGGLFIDEQYYATNDLMLRIAGRLDFHEQVGFRFSPRAGVVYQIDPHNTLKTSVSIGYRNPTLANNFFDFPLGSFLQIKGNPDLAPEKSIWYEAGYLGTFHPDLTFGLDLFYLVLDNLIQTDFAPPSTITFANEEGDIRGGGGELWGQYQWSPSLRFIANYSYAAYQKDSQGVRGVSPHKVNLGLLFTNLEQFTGALTFHYVHQTTWPFDTGNPPGGLTEADSYYTFNAFVGYQFTKNLSARVDAFNFTNNKHRELPQIGEEIPIEVSFIVSLRI